MNTKLAKLLRLLKHPTTTSSSKYFRHLSSNPSLDEPSSPPPPPPQTTSPSPAKSKPNPNPAPANELIQHLRSSDPDNWNPEQIHRLLPSIILSRLPQLLRRLGNSSKALKFLQWIQTNSPTTTPNISPSLAYQTIFELASREPQPHLKLSQLLQASQTHSVPLTAASASLLIFHFGRSHMVPESIKVFNEVDPSSRNTNLYNTFLDVLYKTDSFADAQKVFDEMLEPNSKSPPDERTMEIVFYALLRRIQTGKSVHGVDVVWLVSKFSDHELVPDKILLTKLITKLCRGSQVGQAWEVLHLIMKIGGDIEVASCNALLAGLGQECNFDRMNVLMAEMKEKSIHPDVATFGILINHLCKSRRVDQAMQVLEKMLIDGENDSFSVVPDLITYNTLVKGLCWVGRQEEGLALVDKMRSMHGYSPDVVTYNCLLDGFCRAGEIERSHELFEKMKEDGVSPDVITLNSLVGGMCKHGRISTALDFFHNMKRKGLKGNAITYTALINAFCSVNSIDKAMHLFDEMVSDGCSPDSIIYYSLINGLSRAGRIDDACSVVSRMESVGFCPDAVSYNVLIHGFCKKNRMEEACEKLKEMENAGIQPDGVTYNTLISSLSKSGDFSTVNRLLTKMVDNGLVPNVVTYGALITGYCKAGKLGEAMNIFRAMGSTSKVPPNTVIYNILIDSLCKENSVEDAVSLMDEMQVKGIFPNVVTYNAIFRGLREKNWLDKAFEFMNKMNEQACNPDYVTMEILTEWLSAVGETAKLTSFLEGYEISFSSI